MMGDPELWGLGLAAFGAATLLPLSSEALLGGMALSGLYSPWWLWGVATAGNVAGALVNWGIGRWLGGRSPGSWFPVEPAALERAGRHFRRWGSWTLLLAWVPVIGDPLTVVGGMARVPLPLFTLLVALGKGGRYGALLQLFSP